MVKKGISNNKVNELNIFVELIDRELQLTDDENKIVMYREFSTDKRRRVQRRYIVEVLK